MNNIKIYLFMSNNITQQQQSDILDKYDTINLEIVIYDNDKSLTDIMFNTIFVFEIINYPNILILETDCSLNKYFLDVINKDIKKYNVLIYGSYYYGIHPWGSDNRKHINGVAVYHRNKMFIDLLKMIDIQEYTINYDVLITNILIKNDMFNRKVIDSQFILNLSTVDDYELSVHYKDYKKNTVILHTKNKQISIF